MKRNIAITIAALNLTGCLSYGAYGAGEDLDLLGDIASRARYELGDKTKAQRYQDYMDCAGKDNSSWDALDACMSSKGYVVK